MNQYKHTRMSSVMLTFRVFSSFFFRLNTLGEDLELENDVLS